MFQKQTLTQKKEKSLTSSIFKNFNLDPHFDIKIWNLTSNFETIKNTGENFNYITYVKVHVSMIYVPKSINKIEGYFWNQKGTFR